MGKMYRYPKQSDPFRDTTVILQDKLQEVSGYYIHGLIDEYLYFSVPDDVTLAMKDMEMIEALSETEKALYSVLTEPRLKELSDHFVLVNQRVQDRIRSVYSLEDELKIHRLRDIDQDSFQTYYDWCETCRHWGKTQKALMGFSVIE